MPKTLMEIASEIVQTQVSSAPMTAADISSSLRQVFSTLQELQRAESGEIELPKESAPAQALTPEDSIQNDKVVCLECGAEMRQLTKYHLVSHGMDQKEYRKKYGFTMRTPLAARALTKARSKAAKKRGLPEKLQKYLEARRQAKAKVSEPATTSRPKAAKKTQKELRKEKPALTPQNSIQDDKVICLECGAEFKQLTYTHLASHRLDQSAYKKKYGFSMATPLAAKSLIEKMQSTAQKRGLPENLKQYVETRKQAKAKTLVPEAATEKAGTSKPKRTRLRKKKMA